MKDYIRPCAASPTGAVQQGAERGINGVVVFTINVLPPPGHGRADRASQGATPDALPPAAQIRIVGSVPTIRGGSEFTDQHRLAIALEQRLSHRIETARRSGFVVRMVGREVELRQRPYLRTITVAGEARGDEVAKNIVAVQPRAHDPMPGGDIGGIEEGIVVVNLVEEFPGEQVLAIAIASNEVEQALLIKPSRRRIGEEIIGHPARATVGDVVWILRPIVVAAPRIGLRREHAVVVQTEQQINPALFGELKDIIQLPGGSETVIRPRVGAVLDAKLPGTHPNSRVILTRALHVGKPGVVAEGLWVIPPGDVLANQPQRLAVAGLKILAAGRDANITRMRRRWTC